MKRLILFLALAAAAFAADGPPTQNAKRLSGKYLCAGSLTANCVTSTDANGAAAIPVVTLAGKTIAAGANHLPAAAAGNSGWVALLTDAASLSDCTAGGGTSPALCRSNGSAWVPLVAPARFAVSYGTIATLTGTNPAFYGWTPPVPIVLERIDINVGTKAATCATPGVISVKDAGVATSLASTIPDNSYAWHTDGAAAVAAGHAVTVAVTTAAASCGTAPSAAYIIVSGRYVQ